MQPRQGAFHDPAIHPQAAAMFSVAPSDARLNAALTQLSAMRVGVIAAVSKHGIRATARTSTLATHRWHGVHQRDQLSHIVCIGRCHLSSEWNALRICEEVVFAARFGPIGRVRASLFAPKTARTEALSTAARDQSIGRG